MPKTYIADRRLYHNADRTKVVEEGSPDARYLFVGKGSEIPEEQATLLGLTYEGGKLVLPEYDENLSEEEKALGIRGEDDAERFYGAELLASVVFASGDARRLAEVSHLVKDDFEGVQGSPLGFTLSQVQEVADGVGDRTAFEAVEKGRGIEMVDASAASGEGNNGENGSLDDVGFASPAARKHAEDAGLSAADFKAKRKDSDKGFTAAKVDQIAEAKKSGQASGEEK